MALKYRGRAPLSLEHCDFRVYSCAISTTRVEVWAIRNEVYFSLYDHDETRSTRHAKIPQSGELFTMLNITFNQSACVLYLVRFINV